MADDWTASGICGWLFLLQMHVSGAFSHQETGEEPGFVLFSVYLVSVLSVNIDIRD